MEKEKHIEELLQDADSFIIATKKGCLIVGTEPDILTQYTLLTKYLIETLDEEMIKHAFELALKTEEELEIQAKDCLKEMYEKLGKLLGD